MGILHFFESQRKFVKCGEYKYNLGHIQENNIQFGEYNSTFKTKKV